MLPFWEKRREWLGTWNHLNEGADVSNALQVDYIRVYELDSTRTPDWYWYLWELASNVF